MIQLFKGIASEADALLNDLQSSLHKQEEKLSAYAQQQREVRKLFFGLHIRGVWIIITFVEQMLLSVTHYRHMQGQ